MTRIPIIDSALWTFSKRDLKLSAANLVRFLRCYDQQQIFVELPTGKNVALDVGLSDTIESVRKKANSHP